MCARRFAAAASARARGSDRQGPAIRHGHVPDDFVDEETVVTARTARGAQARMIEPTSSPFSAASTWPGTRPLMIWSSLHHWARGR